jgi:DNA-binding response OmpR family regulator
MEDTILPIEPPTGASARRPTNPRQRILVAEGEADIRRLNSEVLIYSGYQVDSVGDGVAAWETLQMIHYDLVIAAQHLPKVSGVELVKKMQDTSLPLPVIMATRMVPTWEFAVHPWLHTITLLHMPYSFENLLSKVKNVLPMTTQAGWEMAPLPNWKTQPLSLGVCF